MEQKYEEVVEKKWASLYAREALWGGKVVWSVFAETSLHRHVIAMR